MIVLNSTSSELAQTSPYLSDLRRYWRDTEGYYIPAEWMVGFQVICSSTKFGDFFHTYQPDNTMPVNVPTRAECYKAITRDLVHLVAKSLLRHVQHVLRPLTQDQVQTNADNQDYLGPDFIHHINVPRSKFHWGFLGVTRKTTTEPHLTKLYDFLKLHAVYYRDVNIHIANLFSYLAGYNIIWWV